MSYTTYTTQALVCGSRHSNTSDKSYLLFTREAGMLYASARSVREERSKQRYALQDFSIIRVSLVKGRSGWRIGSVESQGNPFMSAISRSRRGQVNFLFAELRRYVHGEVSLYQVFDDTVELLKDEAYRDTNWETLQTIYQVRLFSQLGYIAPKPLWQEVLTAVTIKDALGVYAEDMSAGLRLAIQEAETASHL